MNFLVKFSELNNELMKKFFKIKKTKKFFEIFEILIEFLNFNLENNENLFKQKCYTLIFFNNEINFIYENSPEKNKILIEEKINLFVNNKKFENSEEIKFIKNLYKNFIIKNKISKEKENKIFNENFNNNFNEIVNNNFNENFNINFNNNFNENFEKKKIKKFLNEEKKNENLNENFIENLNKNYIENINENFNENLINSNENIKRKNFNLKPKNKTEKKFLEFISEIQNFSSIFEYLKNNKLSENDLYQKIDIKNLSNFSNEFNLIFFSLAIFLFPFFSSKHKENLLKLLNNFKIENFDKIFINQNLFQKILFNLISNQNLNFLEIELKKNQNFNNSIFSFENEKFLIEKFIFLTILKTLKINFDNLIIQKIIFFIQFFIRNFSIFNIKNNIFYIFYFFKHFYSDFNINFKNNFIIEQKNQNFFYQTKNEILFLNNNKKIEINFLFSQNETNFYFNLINKISHFYNFNPKNFINLDFYNKIFIENLIELFYYKEKFVINNKKKYKQNLIYLETELTKIHINYEKNYNIDPEKKKYF